MEYYSAIKNEEILPFVTTWKVPDGIVQSEISQRRQILYDLTYVYNVKKEKKNRKRDHFCGYQTWGVKRIG